jgi:hypothetical protein
VFALRRIRKGTTVIEYLGDRLSHAKADARYEHKDPKDNHTFLFTVDSKIVIDGGVDGNDARYINHGCDPNCESTTLDRRIFIEAIRTIQPGEELTYDYQIQRDADDAPDVDEVFACRCGAASCRGSMLEAPVKAPKARRPAARRSRTKPSGAILRGTSPSGAKPRGTKARGTRARGARQRAAEHREAKRREPRRRGR